MLEITHGEQGLIESEVEMSSARRHEWDLESSREGEAGLRNSKSRMFTADVFLE